MTQFQSTEIAPGAYRVLILEDNLFDTRRVMRVLRSLNENIRLFVAQTRAEFERMALTRPFDAMLIDYFLPDGDGLSSIKAISDQVDLANVSVIMVVGDYDEDIAEEARETGCYGYVSKSALTPEVLRDLLFPGEPVVAIEPGTESACYASEDSIECLRHHIRQLARSSGALQRMVKLRNDNALMSTSAEIAGSCERLSELLELMEGRGAP